MKSSNTSPTRHKKLTVNNANLQLNLEKYFESKEYEKTISIVLEIEADLCALGDKILAYNKPALDIKLTNKERFVPEEGLSSKVCKKV